MTTSPPAVTRVAGTGLRSGRAAGVALHACAGPFALRVDGVVTPRSSLVAVDAARATVVRAGAAEVATVEHLFAACAALGLHSGLTVEVTGGEVPLADGGAARFAAELACLELAPSPAPLAVRRDATLSSGESRYTFGRATDDGATRVQVTIAFDDPRLAPHAAWDGTRADFVTRIAAARTFAFARDVPSLARLGQASHVDPASVIVLADGDILVSGAPFTADEPARHKLLDLIGDLFLYGGPPRGVVSAFRPGHAATHAVVREALASGVLA